MTARSIQPRTAHDRVPSLAVGVLLLLLLAPTGAAAFPLTLQNFTPAANPWDAGTFGEAQLTGTGTDFSGTYTPAVTAASYLTMNINCGAATAWTMRVRRTDPWSDFLSLSVVVSNPGVPAVSVVTSPLLLTTSDTPFFQGTGPKGGTTRIAVSLSLGFSVLAGPGAYSTTVTYTVASP